MQPVSDVTFVEQQAGITSPSELESLLKPPPKHLPDIPSSDIVEKVRGPTFFQCCSTFF